MCVCVWCVWCDGLCVDVRRGEDARREAERCACVCVVCVWCVRGSIL